VFLCWSFFLTRCYLRITLVRAPREFSLQSSRCSFHWLCHSVKSSAVFFPSRNFGKILIDVRDLHISAFFFSGTPFLFGREATIPAKSRLERFCCFPPAFTVEPNVLPLSQPASTKRDMKPDFCFCESSPAAGLLQVFFPFPKLPLVFAQQDSFVLSFFGFDPNAAAFPGDGM